MKNQRIVSILLTLWLMGSLAGAQSQDWQVVENLKPRTLISVEDMHHIIHDTCRFHGVVDGQLLCGYGSHPFGPNEIAFRQQSIRAVRKEHNSALIGLAIGAGAGAIIGVSRDAYPGMGRGGSAVVGAGLLGGVGAIGGSVVGHISHGKVIYQNPNDPPRAGETAQPSHGDYGDERAAEDRITLARSRYTEPEDATPGANDRLAQVSDRRRGRMFPRRGEYPHSAYAEGSGRHAVIGAVIGFGLGAAVGAKANKDQHTEATVRASLLFGTFGSLIGAVIGASGPPISGRRYLWYRRTEENEPADVSQTASWAASTQTAFRQGTQRGRACDFGGGYCAPVLAPSTTQSCF